MKIFYNKIFLVISIIIILIISFQFYLVSKSYNIDRNSYAILIKGNAALTTNGQKKILKIDEKNLIKSGDVISTIGDNSLLVIEWGDKSITRLGGNSRILVKENLANDNLDKIQISFELLKGKTWSHVISIMGNDSYFKQEVKDTLAAVRGTVFEADYDRDYIACHNHSVEIIKNGDTKQNLSPLNMFLLKEDKSLYFNDLIDNNFVLENKALDKEYIEKLTKEFEELFLSSNPFNNIYVFFKSFTNTEFKVIKVLNSKENEINYMNDYISSLTEKEQQLVFNRLNKISQSINFVNSGDLYDKKLSFREVLIENAPNESFKQNLIKYSMFDLQDMLKSNEHIQNIEATIKVLGNYKEYIENNKDIVNDFSNFIKNPDLNNINEKGTQIVEGFMNKILEFNK